MGDEVKKISFGFSKLAKKTSIVSSKLNQIKPEEKVEFIQCVEGNAIKLKNPTEVKDSPLIIPLRKPENRPISSPNQGNDIKLSSQSTCDNSSQRQDVSLQNTIKLDSLHTTVDNECQNLTDKKNYTHSETPLQHESLDEIAAREILEDLNKNKTDEEQTKVFSVPLTSNPPTGEKESTIEDYDDIPVASFGMAMLRGMGWAPGKGIGKNEKLVTPSMPTLRPKGMGLGADKMLKTESSKYVEDDLKMAKGSFIRVIAGSHKDSYGQIEGFDDESGRLIAKLVLKNISVSLNEFMVQLVNKVEFIKNSKVINMEKYLQYKDEENKTSDKVESDPIVKLSSNKHKIKTDDMNKKGDNQKPSSKSTSSRDEYFKEFANTSKTPDKYRSERQSRSPSRGDSRSRSTHVSSLKDNVSGRRRTSSSEDRSPNNPTSKYNSSKAKKRHSQSHAHHVRSPSRSSSEDSRINKKSTAKAFRTKQTSKQQSTSSSDDSRCRSNKKFKTKKSSKKRNPRSASNSSVEYSKKDKNCAQSNKHRSRSRSSSSNGYSKLKKKSHSHKRKSKSHSRSPVRHSHHKKHKRNK